MVKNRCEKYLSLALKKSKLWHLKLQTNQLCFKKNPADFIVLTSKTRNLIECKECSNDRFYFYRLTQLEDLLNFQKIDLPKDNHNYSYVLLLFWNTNLKNSNLFLCSIDNLVNVIKTCGKKSLTIDKCKKHFFNANTFDEVVELL